MDKVDFIGKAALITRRVMGLLKRFVTLGIDAMHAPARGGASLMEVARWSAPPPPPVGGWIGINLADAFGAPAFAKVGRVMQLDIYGDPVVAYGIVPSPCHPGFDRVRS